jgi:aspartate kinase
VAVALIVQKYGGTSVADAERIRSVADHVARTVRHGDQVVVVVSAMGKETDELIRLAGEVSTSLPGREMDMLLTAGERKSMALLTMALHDIDVPADSFTGSQAGIVTDEFHQQAKILEVKGTRIRDCLKAGRVPVVAGFQGVSTANDVTTLGRGGSDTTAVALAAALDADECEIYTDVSGVFTADPRIVSNARRLSVLSFEEMLEMAGAGCPKPEMRAAEFARNHGVRLHIRSSFTWEPGTRVKEEDPTMEQASVSAVTHDTSEAKVTVARVPDKPGIAAALFRSLADKNVNIDMIVQNSALDGTTDISFTVPKRDLEAGLEVCRSHAEDIEAADVLSDSDIAKVSLIGAGMKTHPGIAATMFETLSASGVNIEMISTSPIRISCIVRAGKVEDAVQALHEAFELSGESS